MLPTEQDFDAARTKLEYLKNQLHTLSNLFIPSADSEMISKLSSYARALKETFLLYHVIQYPSSEFNELSALKRDSKHKLNNSGETGQLRETRSDDLSSKCL
ncbi:hypothetical protein M9Y10_022032 [Tritrichomonas musculus]|uniref:Uncharacterized protein n=1 Tax=Tritrichomonas musculus TaxID=1915356 RepID=A0ABR2KRD9_9EUKA